MTTIAQTIKAHYAKRAEFIAKAYISGGTMQEIGDVLGITRERVRQILRKNSIIVLGRRSADVTLKAIDNWNSAQTINENAKRLGIAPNSARYIARVYKLSFVKRPKAVHGSSGMYARGCRCKECTRGNRDRVYNYRHKKNPPTRAYTRRGK